MDQIAKPRKATAAAAPGERARSRILDTAEELFAREGPAAVTLRSIASAADVNVAAVNYYFGSKEKLFEEMFLRRVVPLNEERLNRLAACVEVSRGRPALEDVVEAYVAPALQLTNAAGASARAIVVQYSLGRVLAMPEVDTKLVRYYASVREAFVAALQLAVPHLTLQEVLCRYYWMGGSVMVALAVPAGMIEASNISGSGKQSLASAAMQDNLIGFLAEGMSAPPISRQHRRTAAKGKMTRATA